MVGQSEDGRLLEGLFAFSETREACANVVMNVRRPLCDVARSNPAASYMRKNTWHRLFAENRLPTLLRNSGSDGFG